MLLRILRFFFLQVSRILQQNLRQLNRRRIRIDRLVVPIAHQHRQPSGVVQMRVRQHQVINRLRIDRQRIPVPLLQVIRALKQSAIHQQLLARRFHQIFRSRYTPSRAQKCQFCHDVCILLELCSCPALYSLCFSKYSFTAFSHSGPALRSCSAMCCTCASASALSAVRSYATSTTVSFPCGVNRSVITVVSASGITYTYCTRPFSSSNSVFTHIDARWPCATVNTIPCASFAGSG